MSATATQSVEFTHDQIELIRRLLLKDVQEQARAMSDAADTAATNNDPGMAGEDARGCQRAVAESAAVLEAIGWTAGSVTG